VDGTPFLVFSCIFINKFCKHFEGRVHFYPLSPPHPPFLCTSMCLCLCVVESLSFFGSVSYCFCDSVSPSLCLFVFLCLCFSLSLSTNTSHNFLHLFDSWDGSLKLSMIIHMNLNFIPIVFLLFSNIQKCSTLIFFVTQNTGAYDKSYNKKCFSLVPNATGHWIIQVSM